MKLFLNLCLLTGLSLPVLAQTSDSLRIEQTTMSVDTTIARPLDNRGQYRTKEFWRAYREERTLVKIGFFGIPVLGSRYEVTVEQKLAPAWSVGASFNAHHRQGGSLEVAQMAGGVFGRRYYSMNRRIREGKGADNFVGNYLMFRLNSPVRYTYTHRIPGSDLVRNQAGPLASSVDLSWGTQKRLGRWGYFDLSTGFSYALVNSTKLGYESNRLRFRFGMLLGFGL